MRLNGRLGATKLGFSCLMRAADVGSSMSASTVSQILDRSASCSETLGYCTYDALDVGHEVFESDESKLSFEMCEFAQMTAGVAMRVSRNYHTIYKGNTDLFSARKLSWTQNTSPREGRHVSR